MNNLELFSVYRACSQSTFGSLIICKFAMFRSTLTLNKGITRSSRLGEMGLFFFPFFPRRSCRAPADGREKCDYRVPKVRSITHYTPFCQEPWLAGRRETELWETAISCLKSCPDICLRSGVKPKHIPSAEKQNKKKILFQYFHFILHVLTCTVNYVNSRKSTWIEASVWGCDDLWKCFFFVFF